MQVLRVRHLTRYRYARAVRLGEHRMMLRPRDDADQQLVAQSVSITPEPADMGLEQDAYGNWIARVRFEAEADELVIHSDLTLVRPRRLAPAGPLDETDPGAPASAPAGRADPEVLAWARSFLRQPGAEGAMDAVIRLTVAVSAGFAYRRRLEPGVQPPRLTLESRSGACRDFALLVICAARALGLRARFASGYVHCPAGPAEPARAGGGHTHAWACVRAPDGDWIDLDPTSGLVGPEGLVRVAVADDPAEVSPIQGSYFGAAGDFLGMEVEVDVRAGGELHNPAAAGEPSPLRSVA